MRESLQSVWRYLPTRVQNALERAPASVGERVQEIRLRRDAPVVLSTPREQWLPTEDGRLGRVAEPQTIRCTQRELDACVAQLCEYSVHTHQQELRDGYIHTPEGCRAGIAGRAVTENGRIGAVRDITGVCLRVARVHRGCANTLVPLLAQATGGVLLCGEPACGKTSLLRDLARQLSRGIGTPRRRVTVVDERGELALGEELTDCEVLAGYPKPIGVLQAVRCLAPDVVLLDELGTEEEVAALLTALHGGVITVASVHAATPQALYHRPALRRCLKSGGFAQVVFLKGREHPGAIARVCTADEVLYEGNRTLLGGGGGIADRAVRRLHAQTAGTDTDARGGAAVVSADPHPIHRSAAVRSAAGGGKAGTVCLAGVFAADGDLADTGTDRPAGVAGGGAFPRTAGRADEGGYGTAAACWRRSGTHRHERTDGASDAVLSADGTAAAHRP